MSPNDSVKTGKKPAKDASTQRYLPFSEIRDNMIMMKDGSSRMVLRVHALNFNLKSTEEQDAILMSYQRRYRNIYQQTQKSCSQTRKSTSPRTNLQVCRLSHYAHRSCSNHEKRILYRSSLRSRK